MELLTDVRQQSCVSYAMTIKLTEYYKSNPIVFASRNMPGLKEIEKK